MAKFTDFEREETPVLYDLLVYHDMDDTIHDAPPTVGQDAGTWFGDSFKDMSVVAVGKGFHEGRIAVVLAHSHRPMQEIQKALDKMA